MDEGAGDPVLLLHGEPTWSFLWRRVIPPLAAGRRVVAPDLLGFGRSDKPTDIGWYSYDRHVETIARLVAELGLERLTVVVHDWGGPIGLRLAVEHEDLVERLVILDTGIGAGSAPSETWLRFRAVVRELGGGLDIGRLVAAGTAQGLTDEVRGAYDAPFPTAESKAGALAFPELVPTEPEHPTAAAMLRVRDALRTGASPRSSSGAPRTRYCRRVSPKASSSCSRTRRARCCSRGRRTSSRRTAPTSWLPRFSSSPGEALGEAHRLGLLALIAALTVAAAIYDGVSSGGVPADTLYAGPYVQVGGRTLAYRRWGSHGSPIVLIGGFLEASDVWRLVGPLLGRTTAFRARLAALRLQRAKGPVHARHLARRGRGIRARARNREPDARRPLPRSGRRRRRGAAAAACPARDRAPRRRRAAQRRSAELDRRVAVDPTSPPSTGSSPAGTGSSVAASHPRTARTGRSSRTPSSTGEAAVPRRRDGAGVRADAAARHPGDALDDLRRVKGVPVVVAWGENDTTDSVQAGRTTAKALHAPFILLPRAAHLSMLVDPGGVVRAIERVAD